MKNIYTFIFALMITVGLAAPADARIKLVALPERSTTIIRLDNPTYTLIEEERTLTLQRGTNKVDFAWNGVSIDPDSIRLEILSHPEEVKLLNVSYPPNENALVWEIASTQATEERVRVSYLLSNIDRVVTYKAFADKEEKMLDLKSHLVLRNFSGEDFEKATILLDYGQAFERGINHEETKQMLFAKAGNVPIEKIWHWDSLKQAWDPEKVNHNVGIPVTYKITNNIKSGFGQNALWGGKVRVFQQDGHGGNIILGEDMTNVVPVGEDMEVYIGDSRDIVVTQRKMVDKKVNVRRNTSGHQVLHDNEEIIVAKIENFKEDEAILKLVQHIPGEWDMKNTNFEYKLNDANTLEFEIKLPAQTTKELKLHYFRRNIR